MFILKLFQYYLSSVSCKIQRYGKRFQCFTKSRDYRLDFAGCLAQVILASLVFQVYPVVFLPNTFQKLSITCFLCLFSLLDCWAVYRTLCVCFGSCKVLELCSLGPTGKLIKPETHLLLWFVYPFYFNNFHSYVSLITIGLGYSWAFVNSIGLWIMAIDGSPIGDRSDFHSCWFLLLLCQEVGNIDWYWNLNFSRQLLMSLK